MAEFQTTTIELSRTFTKSREAVWEALTGGIVSGSQDFYIGTYDGIEPVGMEMETRPGGRLVEHWPGGEGLLWAAVITVHSPQLLTLTRDCARVRRPEPCVHRVPPRGTGRGSELRFSHTPFSVVSEETAGTLSAGWATLLDHLMKWVEDGVRPERPPSVASAP